MIAVTVDLFKRILSATLTCNGQHFLIINFPLKQKKKKEGRKDEKNKKPAL